MVALFDPVTMSALELQDNYRSGQVTISQALQVYLDQIDRYNDYIRAVIVTTPRPILDARVNLLERELEAGKPRTPLHGIPILIKDDIATGDALGMDTTCGTLALVGSRYRGQATVIDMLLEAGAIILGKANLSVRQLQYFLFMFSSADHSARRSVGLGYGNRSGWSAVGGQVQSAYVRGGLLKDESPTGHSNASGSSSGSAVGVAAGFSPLALGSDCLGSLIHPADRSALYTIKPTIPLVPQDGLIIISDTCVVPGPMAKTALDMASLLDAIIDPTKTSQRPPGGYTSAATGSWKGIKIGVVRPEDWWLPPEILKPVESVSRQMSTKMYEAYDKLATLADRLEHVRLTSIKEVSDTSDIRKLFPLHFKRNLEEYFRNCDDCKVGSLQDLVDFHRKHADLELPSHSPSQEILITALSAQMTEEEENRILSQARKSAGESGIDKLMAEHDINVIIGPADGRLFVISGAAGYPIATLPGLDYADYNGRPFGLAAIAKGHQEALLVQLQSAWERSFEPRQPPPMSMHPTK